MDNELGWSTAVDSLATVAASFAGAWAAFMLQRRHQNDLTREQQIEACNRAMLLLLQQANFVATYRRQIMDPYKNNTARHIVMPLTGQLDYSALAIDAASLSFLLSTKATEIPQMMALANESFHRFVAAINDRARQHQEFQRTIESSAVDMEAGAPIEVIEGAIGMRLTMMLKSGTDAIYMLAEQLEPKLFSMGRDVPNVLRTVFKGAKIAGFSAVGIDSTSTVHGR